MAEPKMRYPKTNRFQELFKEHKYLAFKNYLYNYLLRKRAVEKCLRHEQLLIQKVLGPLEKITMLAVIF